jgi:Helix-turn-helix of DDE superfamily endonuclease
MRYKDVGKLSEGDFQRLTGINHSIFKTMMVVLRRAEKARRTRGGPRNQLPLADRLLMALMYWREYRSYFHIGQSYGVHETVCLRNIRFIEDALMASGAFRLPGKKALRDGAQNFEVVIVDATETPIERPQKNSAAITQVKRSATR